MQAVFEFFRARADEIDVLALAVRTNLGDRTFESAIVAFEFVVALVMRERDGAVLALHSLATGAAEDYGCVAAAVKEHHRLLATREAFADGLRQPAGEKNVFFLILLLKLRAHVEDFNFGKRPLLHPLTQLDELVFPALRVVIGLERRRR